MLRSSVCCVRLLPCIMYEVQKLELAVGAGGRGPGAGRRGPIEEGNKGWGGGC